MRKYIPKFNKKRKFKRSFASRKKLISKVVPRWLKRHNKRIKKLNITKIGKIFIRPIRHNTFITFMIRKKIKAQISAGLLGYKGRKKGVPLVREALGIKLGKYILKRNYKVVDIIFVSKIGRFYRYAIKGLVKAGLIIRKLQIKHIHPHGYVRPRKARRT